MARKKWPDEAPVFSLRSGWNEYWPKGAIVELCDFDRYDYNFGVRIRRCDGWSIGHIGFYSLSNLRPLTVAASELLEAAKAAGK